MKSILFQDDMMVLGFIRDRLNIPLIHVDSLLKSRNDITKIAVLHGYSFSLHFTKSNSDFELLVLVNYASYFH